MNLAAKTLSPLFRIMLVFGSAIVLAPGYARAQNSRPGPPEILSEIGIDQRLNEQAPLDLIFKGEAGKDVRLGDYFGEKPVVLALVYYECPMLCNQILNGLVGSLKTLSFDAGDEFQVVTVSFDPRETPAMAAAKKESYMSRYARRAAEAGWHFLTGSEDSIATLTKAVGFRYRYDSGTNQFAHASGIMVLTPQGRVSHYLYGIEYPPRDLRLALVEASAGKIGTPVDQLLLYCYEYDPATGKYGAVVMNMVRLGAGVTLIGVVVLILVLRRRDSARGSRPDDEPPRTVNSYSGLALPIGLLPLFPEAASTIAKEVDALYFFLGGVSLFFSVLVTAMIIMFAIKYRRRHKSEIGAVIHSSLKLELLWTIVPFIIAMVIFAWGAKVYFAITRPPAEALEIFSIGKQWMWRFQHPDGQRELNELHVPVERNIQVTISTEDVIHSFFIPAFRVKADVVPGRITKVWFKATKPGRYHLFCAEYCGTQHSGMIGWVVVMEPAEYQAWLSGAAATGTLASSGERLFTQFACNTCHRKDGQGRGPALDGVFGSTVKLADGQVVVADENYVRESIFTPQAKLVAGYQPIMPTFKSLITEEQALQLISYIKSLSVSPGTTPQQAAPEPGLPAPVSNANRRGPQRETNRR